METGVSPVSAAMEYLFAQMPDLKAMGISAYFYVHPSYIRCFALHPANNSGTANVEAVWEPILSKMSSFPNMTPFQTKKPVTFTTYRQFFDTTYGPLANANSSTVAEPYNRGIVPFDSNLLSAEHLRSPNITYAFRTTGGNYGVLMCSPGDRVGNGSEVSANPGWRKADVLVVGMKDESEGVSMDGLRELAADMGAYINEVSHINLRSSILLSFHFEFLFLFTQVLQLLLTHLPHRAPPHPSTGQLPSGAPTTRASPRSNQASTPT